MNKHKEVFDYAKKKGIIPFSTPTSLLIVDFLEELEVPFYKIASMDITNVQLLEKVASKNKPVIMSTGMAEENDIENAVNYFDLNKLANHFDFSLSSVPRSIKILLENLIRNEDGKVVTRDIID